MVDGKGNPALTGRGSGVVSGRVAVPSLGFQGNKRRQSIPPRVLTASKAERERGALDLCPLDAI